MINKTGLRPVSNNCGCVWNKGEGTEVVPRDIDMLISNNNWKLYRVQQKPKINLDTEIIKN